MLEIRAIAKRFGEKQVLHGIDLLVSGGQVLGLLGPNGAGKTTTIRILTGLSQPSQGEVRLLGENVTGLGDRIGSRLGYVADNPFLYPKLTALELLLFLADVRRIPRKAAVARIDDLLHRFRLYDDRTALVEGFSLGMKRKLAFAAALLHNPDVLILDEPLNGLDPRAVREVKDLLHEMIAQGKAVLMSTHLLDIAQTMCTQVAIIDQGRIVLPVSPVEALPASVEETFLQMTERAGGAPTAAAVTEQAAPGDAAAKEAP